MSDFSQIIDSAREHMKQATEDPIARSAMVYDLWWRWANFELFIIEPAIKVFSPPKLIDPGEDFVYRIYDFGHKFTTSKTDMYTSGMSMCKLFNTIEKMIFLFDERLKSSDDEEGSGGISDETEVKIAFGGFLLAERKGFESVINLKRNAVVINFDPEEWGERYLENVKRIAAKGYGYPQPAPREVYHIHEPTSPSKGGKGSAD